MAIIKKKRVVNKNRSKARDYVNGPELQRYILEWYDTGKEAIPDPIILAVMQIIERLGTKGNFKNYTYIEEMKGDAIEACLIALQGKKYNPYKYSNPFAYFTQCAWNAFIAVITKEQKESYIKHKSLEYHYQDMMLNGEDAMEQNAGVELNVDLIEKFELKTKAKRKKKSNDTMDEFLK